MTPEEVTEQILGAWEEVQAEDAAAAEPPDEVTEETPVEEEVEEEDEDEVEEEETPDEEEAPETEEDEDEEDDGEADEDDEPVAASYESEDLEVRAFLAKYDGDVEKALKGAAEINRLISRQGAEKNAALERAAQLEAELEQARAFAPLSPVLNEQQRDWVETAVGSGNPAGFVNEAIQAGEYDLARAVVQEWAREDPYSAMRAGQYIDQSEAAILNYVEPIDMGRMLDALKQEIPDLPNYSGQMAQVIYTLGDNHPVVLDARSDDLGTAARGIVGIYELAKASSATVRAARDGVKIRQRENGAVAKAKAVVSSSSTSPSVSEIPRSRMLGPGLSLEALEAEFAASK